MADAFYLPLGNSADDLLQSSDRPTRGSEQPATDFSLREKPQEQSYSKTREPPKTAIERNRGASALLSLLHMTPALVSGGILSLTFANIYYSDLGAQNQNSVLDALQLVAKFHEILINASLSAIALHRIRFDLIGDYGVALGYLTSGYQLSSIGYLFTWEFLSALTSNRRGPARPWLPLHIFLPAMFLLAAVVGPASAIVLIPKTNWWTLKNPFNGTLISTFQPLHSSAIWPTQVTTDNLVQPLILPDSGFCTSGTAYQDCYCPSGGWNDVKQWASNYMNQVTEPNITIIDSTSGTMRYVTSSRLAKDVGWAITSTIGARQTRDLGTFWQNSNRLPGLKVSQVGSPKLRPSLADSLSIKKPLVEVQCEQYEMGDSSIAFHTNNLALGNVGNFSWEIPQSVEIPEVSKDNKPVSFQWIDMKQYTDLPLLGGVYISTTAENKTGIWPCVLATYWTPVDIWYEPTQGPAIMQDTPDPSAIVAKYRNDSLPQDRLPQAVTVFPTWADTLNAPFNVSVLDTSLGYQPSKNYNLTLLEISASQFGYYPGDGIFKLSPAGATTDMPWLLSTLLSMHVADGLARVNFGYSTVIFLESHPNTHNHSGTLHDLDDVLVGNWQGQPLGPNVADYAQLAKTSNASSNTEIMWHVERYGYGWGFANGSLVIFGTIVLLAHAATAVTHLFFVVLGGWRVSSAWGSMGEMIALAVGSRVPSDGSMDNTSAGVMCKETWRQVVRVRSRETGRAQAGEKARLELVLGGQLERCGDVEENGGGPGRLGKVVVGKKYN